MRFVDPLGLSAIECVSKILRGGDGSLDSCIRERVEEDLESLKEVAIDRVEEVSCDLRCIARDCVASFVIGEATSKVGERVAKEVAERAARGIAKKALLRAIPVVGQVSTVYDSGVAVKCTVDCVKL